MGASFLIILLTLIAVAVLVLILGSKLNNQTVKVRIKDQKIEGAKKFKSSQDVLIVFAGAMLGAGIGFAITGSIIVTALGLSGGIIAPRWYQKKKENDRLKLLNKQFPEVLMQLSSASKSGNLNPYQALEESIASFPRPARDIFYNILRRVRTGESLTDATDAVIIETGWTDLKALSLGFKLSSRMGIDLDKICDHSLQSYYDKESYTGQIRGSIAQNIMSVRVLTVLPFGVVAMARMTSPDFVAPLFQTIDGLIFFAICVGAIIFGNVFIERMIVNTMENF